MRYRNVSSRRLTLPTLGIVVDPLEEFDSPHEINDGNFEPVEPEEKEAGKTGKKE